MAVSLTSLRPVSVSVLGAVVIAFVVCWLPYHVRRLMFCYISDEQWTP